MAATAVINQVARIDTGAGVLFRKNIMSAVTVRASGHPRRITDILDLPVICLFIIGHDVRGEVISLHHGSVAVAVLAFLIVKFPCLCRVLLQGRVKDACIMETVTIRAGSRILIAFENGFPVAGSHILVIPVAFGTFFDYGLFDILVTGLDGMDVLVTIVTPEV
jgi:hypothetical protein